MKDKILDKKEGWQMNVEIYENYVKKYPKNKKQIREKIKDYLIYKNQLHLLEEKVEYIHSSIFKSLKIISNSKVPMNILANPTIKNGIIKQDRVIIVKEKLDELIMKGDTKSAKEIIDKIVSFIIELWEYKIHENTCKFYSSYGINKKGKIVLVDFLEITNNVESVENQIGKRKWDKPKRYFGKVNKELREYFIEIANKNLTLDTFRKNWGIHEK